MNDDMCEEQGGAEAVFELPFPDDALASAVALSDGLRAALALHGVVFPSLRPDLASCVAVPARPLVELGRANPQAVVRLTRVLMRADVR
ncbi:hypothetical protein [Streptomyces sp. 8L]|uniref:hypothetical protein n=1 Tax=Streptomyces sp. 8L TaxID=2877242 RepID=UPI001CD410FD|nr:hypothetical protein [Streptomyces sp. 8L]MCA1223431.1 hypothetical protein [Streptomyces sp. 8L]